MKNIKITEQNKEIYTKLYNAKRYDSTDSLITTISIGIGMLIIGLGSIPFYDLILTSYVTNFNTLTLSILAYATCGTLVIMSIPTTRYYGKIRKFKKEYPEIDTKIKESELEKALENYERLSKIPKDIEIKKEEHLTSFNDEFREMTNQEKLDFLQKEIEFWDKLSKDEAFVESLKENAPEKKIGRI